MTSSAQASVSYDNRAFRYGYGLFETILVKNNTVQLAQYHWQRLFKGLQQLQFTIPRSFTPEWLETEVLRTVQKNKVETLCRVRLQVYAGTGGLYDGLKQHPDFIIECFPLSQDIITLNENGLVVGIAERLHKSIDALSNLKSCNALIYAMAARQAKTYKWNDALIQNDKGNIIESTIANIFWIKNDMIYTPPLSDGCIAGVMRAYLIDTLPKFQYIVKEASLTSATLFSADEMFLTNAIRGIQWIQAPNNKKNNINKISTIYNTLFT
ncbi:MAG: aminotransferase class IV [Bacteroidota bacterium]